ncbi:LexA family protein [Paenibacillus sp. strain BS8-2]
MKNLSKKQEAALECIKTFIQQKGYSPTTRELAEALGYQSSSTVHSLLDKLVAKGYISKEASGPRTIRIIKVENVSSKQETKSAQFARMKAALRNIIDISTDDFSKHQARYGLGIEE